MWLKQGVPADMHLHGMQARHGSNTGMQGCGAAWQNLLRLARACRLQECLRQCNAEQPFACGRAALLSSCKGVLQWDSQKRHLCPWVCVPALFVNVALEARQGLQRRIGNCCAGGVGRICACIGLGAGAGQRIWPAQQESNWWRGSWPAQPDSNATTCSFELRQCVKPAARRAIRRACSSCCCGGSSSGEGRHTKLSDGSGGGS